MATQHLRNLEEQHCGSEAIQQTLWRLEEELVQSAITPRQEWKRPLAWEAGSAEQAEVAGETEAQQTGRPAAQLVGSTASQHLSFSASWKNSYLEELKTDSGGWKLEAPEKGAAEINFWKQLSVGAEFM